MPKTRKQKEESVSKLEKALKGAVSTVFVGFNKLTVADERVLRNDLRSKGVTYTVAKKSLFNRALSSLGLGDTPKLDGQIAIAYLPGEALAKSGGADPVLPAKGIAEFAKKHEGIMSILGGIFEGKLVDASKMQMISAIPDRQSLLGMLANVLSAPMRGLAIAINEVSKQKT